MQRIDYIKMTAAMKRLTVGALLALTLNSAIATETTPRPPNVVLFLIDDLGWADLEMTGSTFHETPNLNQLAAEGAFFSDAYAANPVCSPTRASILTGKYPSRIGLTNHSGSAGAKGPKYPLNPPEVVGHMPAEDVTLAEALKEAGYTTAHIGKWHLQAHYDLSRDHFPGANGFDVNIAGHRMGQPGSFHFPYQSEQHPSTNVPGMEAGTDGDYLTDVLTDRAIEFIEGNQEGPFFLNMWYYTVHTPIQPRADKLEKYRQKAQALGLTETKQAPVPVYQSKSRGRQDDPSYAAMVESMDENVGRILDALRRLKLEEDTLVIFLSDNGGLSTGLSGNAPTSSFPLRGGKAWVYEGGIRVPLIIKLPGTVTAGLCSTEPVVSTDIYPTVLELVGLPLKPEQHVDGVSLKPLLNGKTASVDREAIYFHYPHYHHINSMGPSGAVRMGDYKLIEVYETGAVELYNLREDLGEGNDLASQMPELAERMQQKLHDWRESTGSLMTTPNPGYVAEQDYRN
jgi:arylsulfatase A-like enzyme